MRPSDALHQLQAEHRQLKLDIARLRHELGESDSPDARAAYLRTIDEVTINCARQIYFSELITASPIEAKRWKALRATG